MAIEMDGTTYLTAGEVVDELGVSRQTLWRWRQEGKIPPGYRRNRDRRVLFTADEVEVIQQFANQVEPISPGQDTVQIKLFT